MYFKILGFLVCWNMSKPASMCLTATWTTKVLSLVLITFTFLADFREEGHRVWIRKKQPTTLRVAVFVTKTLIYLVLKSYFCQCKKEQHCWTDQWKPAGWLTFCLNMNCLLSLLLWKAFQTCCYMSSSREACIFMFAFYLENMWSTRYN